MKVVTAGQAAAMIPNGASVCISGAWMLVPDRLLSAIEERFLACGEPRDLTAIFYLCPGGTADQPGIERLAHKGLLRRAIGGSYPNLPDSRLRKLIAEESVEAHNLPAGMVAGWLREVGARRPGVVTRTGIGTFVDPAVQGGGMNSLASSTLVRSISLDGEQCLFLPSSPVQVAVIRATTSDDAGNLTMEQEPASLTAFAQAAAARASGGITIAQVQRISSRGSMDPHAVKVPGTLVDYVVIEPNPLQASGIQFDASLCGEARVDLRADTEAAEVDYVIARRALREIRPGDVVVLGYGVAALIPHLMLSEGRFGDATFTVEQGSLGGLPLREFGFGNSVNPLAILDAPSQFDLLQGGCFDLAMLSFLQIDQLGLVNVHRLDARPSLSSGIGGFLDIAANAPRLVLLGSFTAGGLVIGTGGDTVKVLKEGRMKKFVSRVDHISFNPKYSRATEMVIVTERCVFRREADRLILVEAAPGIDVDRDILAQMDFQPRVALKQGVA